MDHEFSSASLDPALSGWDWAGLRLSDGSELMLYLLRKKDGSFSPASSGTYVGPSGEVFRLGSPDFRLDAQTWWKSPRSGASYPSSWSLEVLPLGIRLHVTPNLADQEIETPETTGITYWEGSVAAEGTGKDGRAVSAEGYVELTGYAGPLGERF
jgi:predicted secreted hydrolase